MDYDEFRALAVDLIEDFGNGGQATFYRAARTSFDPIAQTETISEASHTAIVVVMPDSDASREEARALGWDLRFMVPVIAGGFVPVAGDHVTLPGRTGRFTVIAPVEAIQPDGEPIAFTIRARQG